MLDRMDKKQLVLENYSYREVLLLLVSQGLNGDELERKFKHCKAILEGE